MDNSADQDLSGQHIFSVAFAGQGPLLDRALRIMLSESYTSALPHVKVVAFLQREAAQGNTSFDLPVFRTCSEMFEALPGINMVMEVDEDSAYQPELRRHAPLSANLISSETMHFFCRSLEEDLLTLEGALGILRRQKSFITMINNLEVEVLLLNEEGEILAMNDFFLAARGGERYHYLGTLWSDLDDRNVTYHEGGGLEWEGEAPLARCVRTRSKVKTVFSLIEGSERRYFRLTVFPLPDELGQTRYLLTREDVTNIMLLQERLMETEKLAAVGELCTYIAHEIRNPLFAIGGFANALLRDTALDDNGRQKAEIIFEESKRLDGILKSILNFSRPLESGAGELGLVDLEELLIQIVTIMSMADESRNIETSLQPQRGMPPALANANLLKQCLINIIKNAYEAMTDGGQLLIKSSQKGGQLEITVSDTGPGISPEILPQIFNPFYSTKNNGAGLGLAMTKKLVEDMGGKLELDSEPGAGTRVRILLSAALAGNEKEPGD